MSRTASPETILRNVREAVKAKATERGERNAVARVLAQYGYVRMPRIDTGRDPGGATVRAYVWEGTPAGDLVLLTGPSIEGEVHVGEKLDPADAPDGVYTQLAVAPARVKSQVEAQMGRIAGRVEPTRTAAPARAKPKPAKKPKPARPAKPKPALSDAEYARLGREDAARIAEDIGKLWKVYEERLDAIEEGTAPRRELGAVEAEVEDILTAHVESLTGHRFASATNKTWAEGLLRAIRARVDHLQSTPVEVVGVAHVPAPAEVAQLDELDENITAGEDALAAGDVAQAKVFNQMATVLVRPLRQIMGYGKSAEALNALVERRVALGFAIQEAERAPKPMPSTATPAAPSPVALPNVAFDLGYEAGLAQEGFELDAHGRPISPYDKHSGLDRKWQEGWSEGTAEWEAAQAEAAVEAERWIDPRTIAPEHWARHMEAGWEAALGVHASPDEIAALTYEDAVDILRSANESHHGHTETSLGDRLTVIGATADWLRQMAPERAKNIDQAQKHVEDDEKSYYDEAVRDMVKRATDDAEQVLRQARYDLESTNPIRHDDAARDLSELVDRFNNPDWSTRRVVQTGTAGFRGHHAEGHDGYWTKLAEKAEMPGYLSASDQAYIVDTARAAIWPRLEALCIEFEDRCPPLYTMDVPPEQEGFGALLGARGPETRAPASPVRQRPKPVPSTKEDPFPEATVVTIGGQQYVVSDIKAAAARRSLSPSTSQAFLMDVRPGEDSAAVTYRYSIGDTDEAIYATEAEILTALEGRDPRSRPVPALVEDTSEVRAQELAKEFDRRMEAVQGALYNLEQGLDVDINIPETIERLGDIAADEDVISWIAAPLYDRYANVKADYEKIVSKQAEESAALATLLTDARDLLRAETQALAEDYSDTLYYSDKILAEEYDRLERVGRGALDEAQLYAQQEGTQELVDLLEEVRAVTHRTRQRVEHEQQKRAEAAGQARAAEVDTAWDEILQRLERKGWTWESAGRGKRHQTVAVYEGERWAIGWDGNEFRVLDEAGADVTGGFPVDRWEDFADAVRDMQEQAEKAAHRRAMQAQQPLPYAPDQPMTKAAVKTAKVQKWLSEQEYGANAVEVNNEVWLVPAGVRTPSDTTMLRLGPVDAFDGVELPLLVKQTGRRKNLRTELAHHGDDVVKLLKKAGTVPEARDWHKRVKRLSDELKVFGYKRWVTFPEAPAGMPFAEDRHGLGAIVGTVATGKVADWLGDNQQILVSTDGHRAAMVRTRGLPGGGLDVTYVSGRQAGGEYPERVEVANDSGAKLALSWTFAYVGGNFPDVSQVVNQRAFFEDVIDLGDARIAAKNLAVPAGLKPGEVSGSTYLVIGTKAGMGWVGSRKGKDVTEAVPPFVAPRAVQQAFNAYYVAEAAALLAEVSPKAPVSWYLPRHELSPAIMATDEAIVVIMPMRFEGDLPAAEAPPLKAKTHRPAPALPPGFESFEEIDEEPIALHPTWVSFRDMPIGARFKLGRGRKFYTVVRRDGERAVLASLEGRKSPVWVVYESQADLHTSPVIRVYDTSGTAGAPGRQIGSDYSAGLFGKQGGDPYAAAPAPAPAPASDDEMMAKFAKLLESVEL